MTVDPANFALKQFFGSFFNQDWVDDAENTHEVIVDFLACNKPSSAQLHELATAIDQLIATYPEAQLPAILDGLGSDYYANPPETYASWLTEIATQFRQAARGS